MVIIEAVELVVAIAVAVHVQRYVLSIHFMSLWLIGTVRAQPETVISRAWVESPDQAE